MDNNSAYSPYAVTGTITTNGDTGTALPTTDIKAWDITIFNGPTTITEFTSSNSSISPHSFDATSTTISVSTNQDAIAFYQPTSTTIQFLQWFNFGDKGISTLATGNTKTYWDSPWAPTTAIASDATTSVVPEPSTAIVAVFGAVALSAYGWSRHRRAQRRQATA
jgi:hypothetical protein